MEKLKLTKPFMYNGEALTEIEYDLDSVTPPRYKAIIRRLQKKNVINLPELDMNVQQEYFAAATELQIPALMLNSLNIKDYMTMGQLVRNFFLSDSDEETETTNPEPEETEEVTDDISE